MKSFRLSIGPGVERVWQARGLALRRACPRDRGGIEFAAAAFGRTAAAPALSGLSHEEKRP
jgi:hypothetical protein